MQSAIIKPCQNDTWKQWSYHSSSFGGELLWWYDNHWYFPKYPSYCLKWWCYGCNLLCLSGFLEICLVGWAQVHVRDRNCRTCVGSWYHTWIMWRGSILYPSGIEEVVTVVIVEAMNTIIWSCVISFSFILVLSINCIIILHWRWTIVATCHQFVQNVTYAIYLCYMGTSPHRICWNVG